MTNRSNAVGPDLFKPRTPTPERQAEVEAGVDAPLLTFDLSTETGAKNAMRPAAALMLLSGITSLVAITISFVTINNDPDLVVYWPLMSLAILLCIGRFAVAYAIFQGSLTAMILAAAYCVYLWGAKGYALLNGDLSGTWYGAVYLLLFTATIGTGLPAAHRLYQFKNGQAVPSETENETDSSP